MPAASIRSPSQLAYAGTVKSNPGGTGAPAKPGLRREHGPADRVARRTGEPIPVATRPGVAVHEHDAVRVRPVVG